MGAELTVTQVLELYGPMAMGWIVAVYFAALYHKAIAQKDQVVDRYHALVVETNSLQQKTIDVISVLRSMMPRNESNQASGL